jgi:hypothetical protein
LNKEEKEMMDTEVQTDYINFDNLREDVDVMDIATGPDRVIYINLI